MSVLRAEKSLSTLVKAWKGLMSILHKKFNHLRKPKRINSKRTTHRSLQHRHYYYKPSYHHRRSIPISYHVKAESYNHKEDNQRDLEQDHDYKKDVTASVALQLNGVDASAEEFIAKMKRRWKLERQISDENFYSDMASFS